MSPMVDGFTPLKDEVVLGRFEGVTYCENIILPTLFFKPGRKTTFWFTDQRILFKLKKTLFCLPITLSYESFRYQDLQHASFSSDRGLHELYLCFFFFWVTYVGIDIGLNSYTFLGALSGVTLVYFYRFWLLVINRPALLLDFYKREAVNTWSSNSKGTCCVRDVAMNKIDSMEAMNIIYAHAFGPLKKNKNKDGRDEC